MVPLVMKTAELKLDLDAARKEVKEKDEAQVEQETAAKWAARAVACYEIYKETEEIKWLLRANDNAHKSLEHAALAGDDALQFVRKEIEKVKPQL